MPKEKNVYVFCTNELKALDEEYVEGYIATPDQDLYNDVVTPNCMLDMVRQINSGNIKCDWEHETLKSRNPIDAAKIPEAKIVSAKMDDKGVFVKALLNKSSERYEKIKTMLKDGFLDAMSIAYKPVSFAFKTIDNGKKIRLLDKVVLLNIAFTGTPVNPAATITNVMLKSLKDEDEESEELIMSGTEVKSEIKAEPAPAKVDEPGVDLKALVSKVESLEKTIAELKAVPKEDVKTSDLEVKLKSLEDGMKAINETLDKPQFKAKVEPMPESKLETEFKSKGVIARL
jgi:HK97 family phage prohead protease